MQPAESDRPRPGFLRNKRWWKRRTFWMLVAVTGIAIALMLWLLVTALRRGVGDDDDDSRRPVPGACLRDATG